MRRRWPKRVLIGISILVVVALAGGVGGWLYVTSVLNSITRFDVPSITAETSGAPIDILLVSSDSRAPVTESGQVAALGSPATQSGQRSGAIIVLRLVPRTRQMEMLSIPRDTYVPIPGTGGSNRINAAFATGASLLVKTIEQDFGIPINHVVVANFPGFEAMVNALGGASLDFPVPVRDPDSGLSVTTLGCQTLNGATALALVRSQHLWYLKGGSWSYDSMSDWSRIQRQQAFVRALINKVNSRFTDIFAMNGLMQATAHNLQVDAGFTAREMISLGLRFRGFESSGLVTDVLPTYSGYVDGTSVLFAAHPYAQQAISSFLEIGSSSPSAGNGPSGTSTTQPGTTTTAPRATTTTVPESEVIFDNPKTLREPWNPKPC